MKLVTLHGRNHINEKLDNWGFSGPVLHGIVATHTTYKDETIIHFKDKAAARLAQKQTGWKMADDCALILHYSGECLKMRNKFYGDWELQEDGAPDRALELLREIATTILWGEPTTDEALGWNATEAGEIEDGNYAPASLTESETLSDIVDKARAYLQTI